MIAGESFISAPPIPQAPTGLFNTAQLIRHLFSFVAYYNQSRCHLGIGKDSPDGRLSSIKPSGLATIVAFPEVGGLQHRYEWRTAA
jgi:hypothetical protein